MGAVCLTLHVVARFGQFGQPFALSIGAFFDHFDFRAANLSLQLALGGVHFFALECKLFIVAVEAVFEAFDGVFQT